MIYGTLVYEKRDRIGYLTLNRPEAGNAITPQMAAELEEVCQRVNREKDTSVVLITGSGTSAFCVGEDLSQPPDGSDDATPTLQQLKDISSRYNLPAMVARIECPVVAAINGDALGTGLALALACDLRIASDKARFGLPDVARGYLMANGITQLLPRIVGRGKAMELVLTAQEIDAAEAGRIGLVHQVVPHEQLLSQAEKVAKEIASKAPLALRFVKEAVNKGMDLTLEQGLRLECDLYMILQTTHDRVEGVQAFRDKPQPSFKGE
ncbi:MAG: enoyl-CoA hydratase-related protein [Chloroflexi bacterium]|nr:enoyl-CoA hydratase-related protein [Chloroflexota bacterium]